ncbi:MAG: hypothetical protein ACOC4M_13685, partial [Promethearchaeia archaeon]
MEREIKRSNLYERWQKPNDVTNILVIRDPYNLAASKYKSEKNKGYPLGRYFNQGKIKLWISYAREYLGQTSFLENKITINYNRWVQDNNYRKNILNKINLSFNEKYENVPEMGGGSSFDGTEYSNDPKKMKVLERWRYFKSDIYYLKLVSNPELYYLSSKIFRRNELDLPHIIQHISKKIMNIKKKKTNN